MLSMMNTKMGETKGIFTEDFIESMGGGKLSDRQEIYDLYKWTFTEGKRKNGKGWSVAIPDGFMVIGSKNDRTFEAIPVEFENEEDENVIPVHLFSEIEQEDKPDKEMWMYHSYARAGIAEVIAVQTAKSMTRCGIAPEIVSCDMDNLMAFSLIQDTSGGSYSYHCRVISEDKRQSLRVQTQCITDEQKNSLTRSVLEWLKSFKFDKPNPYMPKEAAIESVEVLNDLKNDMTVSFDNAVDKAQEEYNAAVNGRLGSIQFMEEWGRLNEETPNTIRDILTKGMEVKEFYHIKADELVEKLKSAKVSASIMKKVYKKLKDMESATTKIKVNDENIIVTETARTKEIQKKWKDEAFEISKLEKPKVHAILDKKALEDVAIIKRDKKIKKFVDEIQSSFSSLKGKWISEFEYRTYEIWDRCSVCEAENLRSLNCILEFREGIVSEYEKLILRADEEGKQLIEKHNSFVVVKAVRDTIVGLIEGEHVFDADFDAQNLDIYNWGNKRFFVSDEAHEILDWWTKKYEMMPEFQAEKKRERITEEVKAAENALCNLNQKCSQLDEKEKRLSEEIIFLDNQISYAEGNLNASVFAIESRGKEETRAIQDKLGKLRAEKTEYDKSISEIQKQAESLPFFKLSLKKELTKKLEEEQKKTLCAGDDIRNLEAELEHVKQKMQQEITALQAAIDVDKEKLTSKKMEIDNLPGEREDIVKMIESQKKRIEDLKTELVQTVLG